MPDIDIIIKAQDKASGALKDVNSELGKMDGHAKGLPGPLGTLAGVLKTGLVAAVTAATAALVGLGAAMGNSIGKAAGMEQSVADIRSIFGKTAPSVEELNKAITGLGLDPKLKVDATQAAAAINMLAKNGITWDEIQGGMAKSTVLLANATNDDFGTAADVATNAMVNFNKSADDMTDVVNGIIGVTQASQFDINDYSLALAAAGGVAGSVGVDFDDFNAMLAATSSSFSGGSDAGTSFKVFLQRLVPTTNSSADAMRKLGLFSGLSGKEFDKLSGDIADTQQKIADLDPTSKNYSSRLSELNKKLGEQRSELMKGGSAFFDANGNMESGEKIAGALSEAFGGLSDSQRIEAASAIFGTDAMRTALSLADSGADTVRKYKDEIGDVSAEDAAATRMDTLKGSWEIFTGVVETLQIQLGTAFLPIVRDVVDWLTKMATEHGPAVVAWATSFAASIETLVSKFSPALTVAGNLKIAMTELFGPKVGGMINGVIDFVDNLVRVVTNLFTNVQSFDDDNPFVKWLLQVGDYIRDTVIPAIGSFITKAVELFSHFDRGLTFAGNLKIALGQLFGPEIGGAIAGVIDFVDNLVRVVTNLFANVKTFDDDNPFVTWLLQVGDYIRDKVVPAVITFITKVGEIATAIGEWVSGNATLSETLGKVWETVGGLATNLFNSLVKMVQDNLPTWIAKFKEWGAAAWQWIVDVTPTVVAKLGEWASAIWKWVTDNAPSWASKLDAFATVAWNWLTASNGVIAKTGEKLGEWASALWKWITDKAPEWDSKLGAYATVAWNWLTVTVIPKVSEKLGEWATALYKWVTDNAPEWAKKLVAWGEAAWKWIQDEAIPKAKEQIGKWWDTLRNYVETNLPAWKKQLEEWAYAAWHWVVDVVGKIPEKLAQWWTAVKAWFDANLPKFKTTLALWTDAMKQWVIDATPKTTAELGNWWVAVSAWFVKKGPDFEVGLVQWTTKLVAWVGKAIPGVITGITDLVTGLVAWMMGTSGDKGLGKIGTGLESWVKAFKDWISGPNGLITRLIPEWQKLGGSVVDAIININQAINDAKARITDAIATALVFVGFAIVDGIKQGIDQSSGGLLTKITDMANAALAAAKAALGIQSPSKQFHWIGQQVGQGFVNGIDSMLGSARSKASEMALIAANAAQIVASNAANYQRLTGMAAPAGVDPATAYYNNYKPATSTAVPALATATNTLASSLEAIKQLIVTRDFKGGIFNMHEDDPRLNLLFQFRDSIANLLNRSDLTTSLNEIARLIQTRDFRGGILGLHEDDPRFNALFAFRDSIESALGIHSPSRYFDWVGEMSAKGFANGFNRGLASAPAPSISNTRTDNRQFVVQVQTSGNAVQDIRNQVELYALTFGGA